MKKVAIHQPVFMPWAGFFALMLKVDDFVLLDDVQFLKRSRQCRNDILANNNKLTLTVPNTSGRRDLINEVQVLDIKKTQKKHLSSILINYKKSQFFNQYFPSIENIYKKNYIKLIDLNTDLILFFNKIIKADTNILFSSKLNIKSKKEKRIEDLVNAINGKIYISTLGSKNYLDNLDKDKLNFEIKYYNFNYKPYKQNSKKFLSNLSILDLVMNLGEETRGYLLDNINID
jgi:hypothetical protein